LATCPRAEGAEIVTSKEDAQPRIEDLKEKARLDSLLTFVPIQEPIIALTKLRQSSTG
jgi:hypothetical protein